MCSVLLQEKPKVSIVVPVYNTEKYLTHCIESILEQSYKNLEIILVDDGSTDNSPSMCDEYMQKDSRVFCFHKENGGVSSARNLGLENISGDYVCFIDSDDIIELNFIETLVAEVENYDVIATSTKVMDSQRRLTKATQKTRTIIGNDNIKQAYIDKTIKHLFYGPVAKLYRSKLVEDIWFDTNLVVGEDIVFNLNFLKIASSVKVIDTMGYIVRRNMESTTHTIERKYSPLYEHNYTIIKKAIRVAKEKWGFEKSFLDLEEDNSTPIRYYNEITNLIRPGSPYNFGQTLSQIKHIHNDKLFMQRIKKQSFKGLKNSEKIVYISSKIGNSFVTYILFKVVLKMRKEI